MEAKRNKSDVINNVKNHNHSVESFVKTSNKNVKTSNKWRHRRTIDSVTKVLLKLLSFKTVWLPGLSKPFFIIIRLPPELLPVESAGTGMWHLHLTRPCFVALGRVLIWVVSQIGLRSFVNWVSSFPSIQPILMLCTNSCCLHWLCTHTHLQSVSTIERSIP